MSPAVRRPAAALTCACLALTTPVVVVAAAKRSWAQPEIKLVTSRGLMRGDPATFRPDAPLTRAALDDLVAGLTATTPVASGEPSAPVTLAALDQSLVRAVDLTRKGDCKSSETGDGGEESIAECGLRRAH